MAGALGGGALLTLGYRGWMDDLDGVRIGSRPVYFLPGGEGAQLIAALEAIDATDALGDAWLATLPDDPGFVALMRSLVHTLPPGDPDLGSALAARVRQDFAEGALCEVEGWRLSLTECRLAGLRRLAVREGLLEVEVATASPAEYTLGEVAPVAGWGPQHTRVGESFNPQLDGHSGLWFRVEGAPAQAKIMIDGQLAKTSVSERTVTSGLHGAQQERILSTPGRYEIALVDPMRKIKQPLGYFEVREFESPATAPSAEALCEVTRWGPRRTRPGVASNEQPDGSMGLWLHTDCVPENVQLLFGDDVLEHRRKRFGLTAHVPIALLGTPGKVPISLRNKGTGEKLVFGHLVIE